MILDDFKPWLAQLSWQHRQWFDSAFNLIVGQGYTLHETNEIKIQEARPITFKKGDCYIVVSRAIKTESMGYRPGIILENERACFEVSISVNAPHEVVTSAIKFHHNE